MSIARAFAETGRIGRVYAWPETAIYTAPKPTSLGMSISVPNYGVSLSPPKPIEGNGYYVVYSKRSDGLVVKKNISKYSFPLQCP